MNGRNKYSFYNQGTSVWGVRNQESTLAPPGGQGLLTSTILETGLLTKTN